MNNKNKISLAAVACLMCTSSAFALDDSQGVSFTQVNRVISSTSTDLDSSGNFNDVKLSPSVKHVLDDVFTKKVQVELDAIRNLTIQLSVRLNDLQSNLAQQVRTNEVVESGQPLRAKYLSVNGKAVNSAKSDYSARSARADVASRADRANTASRADVASRADRANTASRADVASRVGGLTVNQLARSSHRHSIADINGLQAAISSSSSGSSLKHSAAPVRGKLNIAVASVGTAAFVYNGESDIRAGACKLYNRGGWNLQCPSERVTSVCSGGKQGSCHQAVWMKNAIPQFYYL